MVEFYVGESVRFTSFAEVADHLKGAIGVVEGYDEVDNVDFVIVSIAGENGKFDQWVLPDEIVRARKGKRSSERSDRQHEP